MDDFREWLSDNLRYILLGLAILIVLVVLVFGVRACSGFLKGRSGDDKKTEAKNNQEPVPSSPTTAGETTDGKKASTEPMVKDAYPKVNELINQYYQALGEKDTTALKTIMDSLSSEDEKRIQNSSASIEGYQVQEVYTKPGMNEGEYIVYVCYEFVCTGISTPVPALSQLYVKPDEKKELKISGNMEANADISAYIADAATQDDVKNLISDVNQRFAEAIEKDPELKKLLENNSDFAPAGETQEPQKEEKSSVLVATTLCNVRDAASEDGNIIGGLYEGQEVENLGQEGEWIKIDYLGETGYVFGELLASAEASPSVSMNAEAEQPENSETTEALSEESADTLSEEQ